MHAALWDGASSAWADLHPAGASSSEALGTTSTHQVGYALIGSGWRASLWSGTAASWVDLHPAGSGESRAFSVFGGQQVGMAEVGGAAHAGLWNGTAASWTDLHPSGAGNSNAFGTSGTRQVGVVDGHASLWDGTAGSWLDLHPTGSGQPQSQAWGVSAFQQAGWVGTVVGGSHGPVWSAASASIWSGGAASWVDLSPAGSFRSFAYATTGTMQVGFAEFGSLGNGVYRAGVWSGTAASWIDLGALLPAGFGGQSLAYGIWADGPITYVAGHGYNVAAGRNEALLWTLTVPEPGVAGLLVCYGIVAARRRRRHARGDRASSSAMIPGGRG